MNNMIEFDVDLSWSIWTEEFSSWEKKYPQLIEELKNLEFGKAVKINSSPKKVCRYGNVILYRKENNTYLAKGTFYTSWGDDFVEVLANDYDIDVEDVSFNQELVMLEIFPVHDGGCGCKHEFTVCEFTLENLIGSIDNEELILLEANTEQVQFVEEFVYQWRNKDESERTRSTNLFSP